MPVPPQVGPAASAGPDQNPFFENVVTLSTGSEKPLLLVSVP